MNENEIIERETIEPDLLMTREEATELTEDIKATTSALYIFLRRAHDDRAWIALGYTTWGEYVAKEFEFSRARSYQLLNQANVIEELSEASGVPLYITERDARAIKKRLPEITEKLKKEVKDNGLDKEEAEKKVKEIIEDDDEEKDSEGEEPKKHKKNTEDDDAYEEAPLVDCELENTGEELSEEDKFILENLVMTFNIFKSLPEVKAFSRRVKNSTVEKKALIELAESSFAWITQFLDEIN